MKELQQEDLPAVVLLAQTRRGVTEPRPGAEQALRRRVVELNVRKPSGGGKRTEHRDAAVRSTIRTLAGYFDAGELPKGTRERIYAVIGEEAKLSARSVANKLPDEETLLDRLLARRVALPSDRQ